MSISTAFQLLIENGWAIMLTSCTCGGKYAWLKPRPSGALEMVGCICHNDPIKLWKEFTKAIDLVS